MMGLKFELHKGTPVLSRFEQSEKFVLLTPNRMKSQETFNIIVNNFFRFPSITHMPKSDNQSRGYGC
jgi:hypothetical protein